MIRFEDEFSVAAAPAEVMALLSDVETVVACVPGAALDGVDADGHYRATMVVSFGPKRIKFSGRFTCEFDTANHTGLITGGGAAAGRAANVQVVSRYSVLPVPGETGASVVKVGSETEMHGVLAQFAATGGVPLARQLMKEFSTNIAARLGEPATAGASTGPGASVASDGSASPGTSKASGASAAPSGARGTAPAAAPPLSFWRMLARSLADAVKRLFKNPGKAAEDRGGR